MNNEKRTKETDTSFTVGFKLTLHFLNVYKYQWLLFLLKKVTILL